MYECLREVLDLKPVWIQVVLVQKIPVRISCVGRGSGSSTCHVVLRK